MTTMISILFSVHVNLQIPALPAITKNRSKRVEIKELIRDLKKVNPFVEGNIFKSVENVNIDTVVGYKQYDVRHSFLENYDGEPGSASENAADAAE